VEATLRSGGIRDTDAVRQRAIAAAGKLNGPNDLASNHDEYLAKAFEP
jgi:hypothetical protein